MSCDSTALRSVSGRARHVWRPPHRRRQARVARSPESALGQRLYVSRERTQLTEGTANATGLSVELITATQSDGPLGLSVVATLQSLLGMLAGR
jgi:hypothetical protein